MVYINKNYINMFCCLCEARTVYKADLCTVCYQIVNESLDVSEPIKMAAPPVNLFIKIDDYAPGAMYDENTPGAMYDEKYTPGDITNDEAIARSFAMEAANEADDAAYALSIHIDMNQFVEIKDRFDIDSLPGFARCPHCKKPVCVAEYVNGGYTVNCGEFRCLQITVAGKNGGLTLDSLPHATDAQIGEWEKKGWIDPVKCCKKAFRATVDSATGVVRVTA
jgi:hypothetical protein